MHNEPSNVMPNQDAPITVLSSAQMWLKSKQVLCAGVIPKKLKQRTTALVSCDERYRLITLSMCTHVRAADGHGVEYISA